MNCIIQAFNLVNASTIGGRLGNAVHRFRQICRAGLQFRIHDLRHAFASLLLAFGETVLYVSRQLGHSSAKLTLDTYGHLLEEGHRLDREATLGKLEAALRGATRVLLKSAGAEETISETRISPGAADRIRTDDPRITSAALYH